VKRRFYSIAFVIVIQWSGGGTLDRVWGGSSAGRGVSPGFSSQWVSLSVSLARRILVKIVDGVVILTAAEVDRACPTNLRWAVSQVSAFGVEICSESRKLRPFLLCTRLLEAAGLEFEVEEPETVTPEADEIPD